MVLLLFCKGLSETLIEVLYVLLTCPWSWSSCFFLVWFEVLFLVVGSGSYARFRDTLITKNFGQFKFRTSVGPKFQRLVTVATSLMEGKYTKISLL